MIKLLKCRRSIIALISIGCLTVIALLKGHDVSMAISAVAIGLAGANAYEKKGKASELEN